MEDIWFRTSERFSCICYKCNTVQGCLYTEWDSVPDYMLMNRFMGVQCYIKVGGRQFLVWSFCYIELECQKKKKNDFEQQLKE